VSRASGILLHPTSLPGPYGIGDLGPAAYQFVDFLVAAGQTYWQILPLGPTGYGDSPYQTFSAFAGNPLLISPKLLVEDGFLPPTALDHAPPFPAARVEYGPVIDYKKQLLEQAFVFFEEHAAPVRRAAVERFATAQQLWLDDFALFMALKEAHDGAPWTQWESDIAARQPAALAGQRQRLEREIRRHIFVQYLFFRQWTALKEYVSQRGIRLIGDAPIFAAHDSADCWAQRELFHLAPDGRPTLVAGVPPDYFSATGQLWGNPLYRWDVLAATGYAWWIDRLRTALSLVDVLRLDHFRGFAGYWAIPGDAPTAETGTWEPGPGADFFTALQDALGSLPFIAEDLGVITPDVVALRERFGFPGMKVLQFAFDGDATSPHLPHNYIPHCVVYTGTHDNDTTAGWLTTAPRRVRTHALAYMASDGANPAWDLIRLASASVAETAIVPLQDLLGLGSEARMNRPGQSGGNWRWRYTADMLTEELAHRARTLGVLYGRATARPTGPRGGRTRQRGT
jgi:4-alpha-glucanotransferase